MTLGTLRDQVIYPDTADDQRRKGISDDAIADYLDKVIRVVGVGVVPSILSAFKFKGLQQAIPFDL